MEGLKVFRWSTDGTSCQLKSNSAVLGMTLPQKKMILVIGSRSEYEDKILSQDAEYNHLGVYVYFDRSPCDCDTKHLRVKFNRATGYSCHMTLSCQDGCGMSYSKAIEDQVVPTYLGYPKEEEIEDRPHGKLGLLMSDPEKTEPEVVTPA